MTDDELYLAQMKLSELVQTLDNLLGEAESAIGCLIGEARKRSHLSRAMRAAIREGEATQHKIYDEYNKRD